MLGAAQFVSQAGDFLYSTCVVFLVLLIVPEDEGAAWKAGVVTFLHSAPFLVIGVLAGGLADRVDRLRLMLASDLARAALLVIVLPLVVSSGWLEWWSLAVIAFLLGASSTPFNPARDALVPSLVERRHLLAANGFFQTSQQLAMIVGTLAAGAYLRQSSQERDAIVRLLVLDGITFLFSFGLLSCMRVPAVARRGRVAGPFLADVLAGLRRIRGDRALVGLLILTAINNFFIMGPAVVGANLYIKHTLGLGAAELALFECAMGVGWLLGTFALIAWGRRFGLWSLLLWALVIDGATYVPFYWIDDYGIALAAIALHGTAIPFITGVRTALVQQVVEEERLGKVFAMVNLTVVGFTSLSMLATGIAGETLSPPTLFAISGIGGAMSGVIALLVRGRCGFASQADSKL